MENKSIERDKNKEQYIKMTQTPVKKLIVKLGIPTIIIMLVTNIYNLADTFFVGSLGTSASGAVGVVFAYMSIVQAVGFMFGQGAGSLISRKLGQKDAASAVRFASASFFASFFVGIIISILGIIFNEPFIYLLGSTKTIFPFARDYILYIFIGTPFIVSSFVLNNILRFEGLAKLAMIGMMSGAVLNIALDPLLIFVFDLGISGAGISTCVSQIIGFIILLSMFLRGKTVSRIKLKTCRVSVKEGINIIATGLPSLIRQGLSSVSIMILNSCAAEYDDPAVSAMSIVGRVGFFVFAIGLGLGQGYQPVVGYNYGAGKYKRVRAAFRFTAAFSTLLIFILSVVCFIFAPELVQFLRDDEEVIKIGTAALRYQMAIEFMLGIIVTTNMTLQVTGKSIAASVTAAIRSGLYFIPLLLVLSNKYGLFGIQIAQPLADVLAALTSAIMIYVFFKKLPAEDNTIMQRQI